MKRFLGCCVAFVLALVPAAVLAAPSIQSIPQIGSDVPDPTLAQVIQHALPDDGGLFGVAVKDLKTGRTALLNADAPFPSASLYKVGVMYEFYRQKQLGLVSTGDVLTEQSYDYEDDGANLVGLPGAQVTAGTALQLMMTISDNVAAHMVEDQVGRANINRTFDQLGLHSTRIPTFAPGDPIPRGGQAYTTAHDMLRFFQAVATGSAIDPDSNHEMIDLLLANEANERLPAMLPPGTPVAHKNGELDGTLNDAGIVYGPNGPYAIAVLSTFVPNALATPDLHGPGAAAGVRHIAQISRAVYDYFGS